MKARISVGLALPSDDYSYRSVCVRQYAKSISSRPRSCCCQQHPVAESPRRRETPNIIKPQSRMSAQDYQIIRRVNGGDTSRIALAPLCVGALFAPRAPDHRVDRGGLCYAPQHGNPPPHFCVLCAKVHESSAAEPNRFMPTDSRPQQKPAEDFLTE